MILHRVFPRDRRAGQAEPGGPLWWPRQLQGKGRHDNPEQYACMYVSETALSPVVESLAPFRGAGELVPEMLVRGGLPLARAALELPDAAELVDLDDPRTLVDEGLRPSTVATRDRSFTQPQAARLHADHAEAMGLRWWSSLESLWLNVTLFDRAGPQLEAGEVEPLSLDGDPVREAASFLGLRLP